MSKNFFIHLVADYGVGDPAFGEVIQKLTLLDPHVRVYPTSVPAFSTVATGFWTAQYALVNPLPDVLIYTNTAPRKDVKSSRVANEGEKLMFAELENGMRIVGVNSGFCFSFIKPEIKSLHVVNVANKGSQFRSRDFYPEAVIGIAHGEKKYIGGPVTVDKIPDVPPNRIASIDGYGNLKTTNRVSAMKFKPGQPLRVTLNNIIRTGYFTDGTFSVNEGQLAIAPGSSGGDDRFIELFIRGLSAAKEFGKPKVEQDFIITPV